MQPWTIELENLLLHALRQAWHVQNLQHFRAQLEPPMFALRPTNTKLGEWSPGARCISMALPFVRTATWRSVESVLQHEMAHQYVHEVLGIHDENPHGAAFQQVCRERHFDARAAGTPHVDDADAPASEHRVQRRVRKLLALAASQNWHEADAAARTAHRLMLEYNLALQHESLEPDYLIRSLHEPQLRLHAHQKMLGGLLAAHYFVHVVVARVYLPNRGQAGFVLEAAGTADNLKMAEYVFRFLQSAAHRSFEDAVRDQALPPKSKSRFLTGFVRGVAEKLRAEAKIVAEEGLVWVGDPRLQSYVDRKFGRLSNSKITAKIDAAHLAGKRAGRNVVIHKPVEAPSLMRDRLLEQGTARRD